MIRTLALAAAAAAVGYVAGQRAAESPESRFSKPEVAGDEVAFEDEEWSLSDDARQNIRSDIDNSYLAVHRIDCADYGDDDKDGVIGL